MYLPVIFIIATACSLTAETKAAFDEPIQIPDQTLISLDESLSRCGQYEIDIREITIHQIQEHFKSKKLTSSILTKCYLRRIEQLDDHLKSVIEVNPDARLLAIKADIERRTNSNRTLLYGIPVLIKDSIGTADFMQTTCGAEALENVKPKRDAAVVKLLREAGAIILGKTNPSEWAYFRDVDAPNGWSGRGGQTLSAYVLNFSPSGSSTGSAVSVSANLAAVSLGTETDGSIISPASINGVVGLKTTIGTVPTEGVIPLAFSNDVVGPMARTVQDAAILLGTISNIDLQGCDVNITTCLPDRNFTIGIPRIPFWSLPSPAMRASWRTLDNTLKIVKQTKRAVIIDPVRTSLQPPNIQESIMIFSHEFKFSINNYLRSDVRHREFLIGRNISSLSDIIKFNEEYSTDFNQSFLKLADQTDGLENQTYIRAKENIRQLSLTFLESMFESSKVDALATPCQQANVLDSYAYAAYAGYPTLTVPVATNNIGLPYGMCLVGRKNSEPVLLKLGYIIELSRLNERTTPTFFELLKPEEARNVSEPANALDV